MSKLFQMSIIFAMIFIPIGAARERVAERGLRKAIKHLLIFNLAYLFILLFVYGRI